MVVLWSKRLTVKLRSILLAAFGPSIFRVATAESLDDIIAGLSEHTDGVKYIDEHCFVKGSPFTFERCCRQISEDVRGNPSCWTEGFDFQTCCMPKIVAKINEAKAMMERGEYWPASDSFFELLINYATPTVHRAMHRIVYQLFEKAAVHFRGHLEKIPENLSYFQLLFHGVGLDCEQQYNDDGTPMNIVLQFYNCCTSFPFHSQPCSKIYEMLGLSLGRGRHKGDATAQDEYYMNMSELYEFRHFTPSIIMSSDFDPDAFGKILQRAYDADEGIAKALAKPGEPTLGIVWARHVDFRSEKFNAGIYFLTKLFRTIRDAGNYGPVDIIEIGAGYGNFPRLLAHARADLQRLEKPLDIRSYTILDVQYVVDLQKWYLNRTVGEKILLRDWSDRDTYEGPMQGVSFADISAYEKLWPELGRAKAADDALRVDLVSPERRDIFAHFFATAHAGERTDRQNAAERPIRALVAINSWHEFPFPDYFWYYNHLIASPPELTGVDWVLYVSNVEWNNNTQREDLLLKKMPNHGFKVHFEWCSTLTCVRILERASSS
eukprot:TRINITY_DN36542_c0_g1_i6.p1 TRINITY_DN36542_c0_g1~~TRINITY_DN36542_c0_g1_i6.p1  ORF type:complete len:549 (-),score=105.28 TRINITY_DN36542_c0_g1_i6:641-2287(-)